VRAGSADRGNGAAGEPTGLGVDTVTGPLRAESANDLAGLSYLSYVHPKDAWSVAFFQHQPANFEFALETQGVFGPGPDDSRSERSGIERGRIDMEDSPSTSVGGQSSISSAVVGDASKPSARYVSVLKQAFCTGGSMVIVTSTGRASAE